MNNKREHKHLQRIKMFLSVTPFSDDQKRDILFLAKTKALSKEWVSLNYFYCYDLEGVEQRAVISALKYFNAWHR